MATIENRSRFLVTVRNRPDLSRHFPYDKVNEAEVYCEALQQQGFRPLAKQLEESIYVRVRKKGYKRQAATFTSIEEAQHFIQKLELEHTRGLDVDYTKARNETFIDLLHKFIKEKGGAGRSKKSWDTVDCYRFQRFLRGGTGEFNQRDRKKMAMQLGVTIDALPKHIEPDYPWMLKPLAAITTEDIESYIQDRIDAGVEPSTVDRELDEFSAIFNVATSVWDYHLAKNPMASTRRPKYFNERDRRLRGGEFDRLLAAAQEEDLRRCSQLMLDELAGELIATDTGYAQMSLSNRKRQLARWRKELEPRAKESCNVVPIMETFLIFQLETAARRGEALSLTWQHVYFEPDRRAVHFPLTKNGRKRNVPLSRRAEDALRRLQEHTCGQKAVFGMSVDYLKNAWSRVREHAGVEDLHIHDLRHEAISRLAETGKFTLIDLQAISGHLDVRMLLRYAHLCTAKLASRIDEALGDSASVVYHSGRKRLKGNAALSMRAIEHEIESANSAQEPAAASSTDNVVRVNFGVRRGVV